MTTQTLNLQNPIVRGDKNIAEITLHNLNALLNMNVDAIVEVLPRISDPQLTAREVEKLSCPDLLQAGIKIASFFLPSGELGETA
jgi:alpha-D-ribose 1-methylphosphonate 5-triphosphate synthase subunit PhnI